MLSANAFADGLLPAKPTASMQSTPVTATIQQFSHKLVMEAGTRIPITI